MKHRFLTGAATSAAINALIGAGLLATLLTSSIVHAETTAAPAGAATGQIVNLLVSTAAVVGLIVAAAWLLKRLNRRPYTAASTLRVVAGTAVGPRERVVVVEVGATWLVLGVAPGHVSALHQMPRVEPQVTPESAAQPPHAFAPWLARAMQAMQSKKHQ